MYFYLLMLHSAFRWLALGALVLATGRAALAVRSPSTLFGQADNALRHWTATLAHIQLSLGAVLYFYSPVVKQFSWARLSLNGEDESTFFALIHACLMLVAVSILSIGSAKAKRASQDQLKFKTLLNWYGLALLFIIVAIPWPFLPWAHRPLFRL